MRVLDVIFWVFAGGVVLFIAVTWLRLLIPADLFARRGRRSMSAGGGFADNGVASFSSDISSGSEGGSEIGGSESGGGDSSGGDFSGGGGESGGGGSTGGW